jgi:hypothetical protein
MTGSFSLRSDGSIASFNAIGAWTGIGPSQIPMAPLWPEGMQVPPALHVPSLEHWPASRADMRAQQARPAAGAFPGRGMNTPYDANLAAT